MQAQTVVLDSGFAPISAFTRVFDALWARPGMTLNRSAALPNRRTFRLMQVKSARPARPSVREHSPERPESMNMTHYMELLSVNQPWNLLMFMAAPIVLAETIAVTELRSEERRVGKEC